ncbi:MAG: DUF4340 domain-containing protein [Chloroflexi bacterium]|nr:DUF4340 domain-containing protein [Chloroflexota bacterium]
MKSRQVGLVLIALIAIGIAGLIARAVSSGSDQLVLSGLLPLSPDVVDSVSLRSDQSTAELRRFGTDATNWRVGDFPVFPPKLLDFWSAVSDIDGAQLVARNPANHSRMGVADGQGTVMEFFLGGSIQEQFVVGKWSPDVRLCYLRRPSKNEVYSIPCASPDVFDTDPDGWRNRIVLRVPRAAVESIVFTSPEEDFTIALTPLGSVLISEDGQEPADNGLVLNILLALENLPEATGFASAEEMEDLKFDASTPSIVINTVDESGIPTTRLRFIPRDDISYYVKNPAESTVYIMDRDLVEFLLKRKEDFALPTGE